MQRGRLFIVSAPSGAGKTSLLKSLFERAAGFSVAVSHTTRPKRPGEKAGRDYHFVDRNTFEEMKQQGEFLEHAEVFGHCYGTARRFVENELQRGCKVVLEIDWQGARQVRSGMQDVTSIFILPPSRQVLHDRLQERRQDSEEVIARRMSEAMSELSHCSEFDRVVVNDDFEHTCDQLERIFSGRETERGAGRDVERALRELGLAHRERP